MNEKQTVIVVGDTKPDGNVLTAVAAEPETEVDNSGGISRRVPSAAALLSAMGVRRRDVVRRNRAERLKTHPIIPGGGARERARRLRQLARNEGA